MCLWISCSSLLWEKYELFMVPRHRCSLNTVYVVPEHISRKL